VRRLNTQLLLYARDLNAKVQQSWRQAQALAAANERLQRLDQLKLDFMALISHELRTPLTSMGMIKVLDRDRLDEASRQILELIEAGYERLHAFVERVLGYFRSLATNDDWSAGSVDLVPVVQARAAALAGARVTLALPATCVVRGAEQPVGQALDIVLDNAVKHSAGAPRVEIALADGAAAELTIRDHGRGFPPHMGVEILRAFTPGDVLHHSRGTVFSLALAVQLLDRCGARLTAHSDGVGKGATFTLAFAPVAAGAAR
jgi:signal transduction histidine kinase